MRERKKPITNTGYLAGLDDEYLLALIRQEQRNPDSWVLPELIFEARHRGLIEEDEEDV